METLYFRGSRAVKGKPSKLKDEILEFLAINGRCSKADLTNGLGPHKWYADISGAVNDLNRDGYIKVYDKRSDRRPDKKRIYYVITEKGLKTLLSIDSFDSIKFWGILDRYCRNAEAAAETVTLDRFQEFYQIVIKRNLKYPAHGFFFFLDIFDDLYNKWFREVMVKSNSITPLQKVVEILASYPKITLEKLVEKTNEPEERIREILRSHSSTSRPPEKSDPLQMLHQGYIDLLSQNIIITTPQDANNDSIEPTHELSLFGVMLCLVMIRYSDMRMLKDGLYRKSSFERYYDRIASNYRGKLPLIFGRWNQLKAIFKEYLYYNFGIILDGEIRSNTKDLPSVRKGGNKELIEGIREIILDNQKSMSNFLSAGCKILEDKMITQAKALNRPSLRFREGLKILLDPFLIKYPVVSGNNIGFVGAQGMREILKHMEESFADEIAAFYYINLCNDSNIGESESRKYYYHCWSVKPLDKSPKQCLSLFLEQNKEEPLIKEWLYKWREDLEKLQYEVQAGIKAMV